MFKEFYRNFPIFLNSEHKTHDSIFFSLLLQFSKCFSHNLLPIIASVCAVPQRRRLCQIRFLMSPPTILSSQISFYISLLFFSLISYFFSLLLFFYSSFFFLLSFFSLLLLFFYSFFLSSFFLLSSLLF